MKGVSRSPVPPRQSPLYSQCYERKDDASLELETRTTEGLFHEICCGLPA